MGSCGKRQNPSRLKIIAKKESIEESLLRVLNDMQAGNVNLINNITLINIMSFCKIMCFGLVCFVLFLY